MKQSTALEKMLLSLFLVFVIGYSVMLNGNRPAFGEDVGAQSVPESRAEDLSEYLIYLKESGQSPLDYVTMLFAIAIGYYVFGEVPRVTTWIGAPLVIIAGGIILWREYVNLKRIRSMSRIEPG